MASPSSTTAPPPPPPAAATAAAASTPPTPVLPPKTPTLTISTDTSSFNFAPVRPTVISPTPIERSDKKTGHPGPIPSPPPTSSTTKSTLPITPTINIASSVPSSLKSPAFPSELPRSPMSATFSLLPHTPAGVEGALKTPITPPVAYMDFLKNAIASPSDLKSPKFLPHHHPSGHASAGPSSPMFPQGSKRYRASLSGPSGGMPSPGLLGAHMAQALAKANANSSTISQGTKREHVYTPTYSSALSSARSSTSSLASTSSSGTGTDSEPVSRSSSGTSIEREPVVAESSKKVVRFAKSTDSEKGKDVEEDEDQEDEDEEMDEDEDEDDVMEEVDCTRKQSINKDGTVTIKQVVTTTVTFKPRMSLMPAPKGKRRRIE